MNPIFIDFEASSLSHTSWPIEVGIAWIEDDQVMVNSRLIRPAPTWSMEEWYPESEAVHGIPREALDTAEPAHEVASWLQATVEGRQVVSDAPEFDQRWCDRLIATIGDEHDVKIDDFDRAAWWAFSDRDGSVAPGNLHRVYNHLTNEKTDHRAGDDATRLARAWLAGLLAARE